MIKRLFYICCFLISGFASGQIKVYTGDQAYLSNMIYQVENNIVYHLSNPSIKVDILYIDGEKVYLKDRKFFNDVKYTLKNNVIYKGTSTTTFDKLFTLKEGKLYIGDGDFSSQCLYTLKDGKIYKGDSTSTFDLIMCYEVTSDDDLIKVAMLITPY